MSHQTSKVAVVFFQLAAVITGSDWAQAQLSLGKKRNRWAECECAEVGEGKDENRLNCINKVR